MTPRIEVAGELLSDPAAMVLDSVRTMAATLVVRVPWLDATEREAHSVVLYLAAVEGAGRGAGGSGGTGRPAASSGFWWPVQATRDGAIPFGCSGAGAAVGIREAETNVETDPGAGRIKYPNVSNRVRRFPKSCYRTQRRWCSIRCGRWRRRWWFGCRGLMRRSARRIPWCCTWRRSRVPAGVLVARVEPAGPRHRAASGGRFRRPATVRFRSGARVPARPWESARLKRMLKPTPGRGGSSTRT